MPKKTRPDKPITPAEARQRLRKAVEDLMDGIESRTLALNIERPKKMNPLKLTQQQRETVLSHTQIKGTLRKKIEAAGEGTQVIEVTNNELDELHDAAGSASVDARSPHKKRLHAVQRRIIEHFTYGLIEEEKARKKPSSTPTMLYQFKITLLDITPPIWRRIQIADCTLDKLHEHIQAAMGWMNCHLHRFEIDDCYGPPSPDGKGCKDESRVRLTHFVPKSGRPCRWRYSYDFGDGWQHEVLFEGNPPVDPKKKYPLCVEGERACPPENCGGPFGYADFLQAVMDPDHEEHEQTVEWVGGDFKPERFSAKDATRAMREGMRG